MSGSGEVLPPGAWLGGTLAGAQGSPPLLPSPAVEDKWAQLVVGLVIHGLHRKRRALEKKASRALTSAAASQSEVGRFVLRAKRVSERLDLAISLLFARHYR